VYNKILHIKVGKFPNIWWAAPEQDEIRQLSDDPTPPGGHAQRRYSNKYFPTCAGLPAQSTDDDRIVRYYSMLNDRIVTYILAWERSKASHIRV